MTDEIKVDDAEIDKLYQEAEGIDAPTMDESLVETKAETAPAPLQEFEFNANGKPFKVKLSDPKDIEKLKTWASMGVDAPNKIGELNNRLRGMEETTKKYADYDTKYAPYKQIDEWANKNPDQWKSLEQLWKEKQQGLQQPGQQVAQLPPEVLSTINELKQDREARLLQEQEQQRVAADQSLDGDIKSVQEQFSHLDWNAKDESGKSLLKKVLEHGIQNGIANFKTAFRDYYFDEAVKSGQEKGKEQVSKTIQKNSRLGLLGKTPGPTKGNSANVDLTGLSLDQAHKLALEELGL